MKRALTIAALAAALLAVVGALWTYQHRQLVRAQADAEAARLAMQRQIVADAESRTALKAEVADLLAKNKELADAYRDATTAAPSAHPVGTARLDTGPLPVLQHPPVGRGVPPDAPADGPPPSPSAGASPPQAACALADADKLSIEVEQIALQTDKGTLLIVGTAAAYKLDPKALLASGRFRSPLSDAATLQPPTPPRWGALLLGGCTAAGCGPGAAVLPPPMSVLGVHVEGFVGALALPGALAGVGGVGLRW